LQQRTIGFSPLPVQSGRLPYSDSGFWRDLKRAGEEAGIGAAGTHAFRRTYRSWLDAVRRARSLPTMAAANLIVAFVIDVNGSSTSC